MTDSRGRMERQEYLALVARVRAIVAAVMPPRARPLVVSRGDDDLLQYGAVRGLHFPQTEQGLYAGYYPSDSDAAVQHLELLRLQGATHIVFPATSFWWLEHYGKLRVYLTGQCVEVCRTQDVAVYELGRQPAVAEQGGVPIGLPLREPGLRPPTVTAVSAAEARRAGTAITPPSEAGNLQQPVTAERAYIDQVLAAPFYRDPYHRAFEQHAPRQFSTKAIAFYLPQFHAIPENDTWWGPGFTEWANTTKAVPQFVGHYQPHLPADLGFYDLRSSGVQHAQVALARNYGIHGFCFHFYWFNGRRVLERPLDQYLADRSLDLPFCISWANENWTRRWDGLDSDVLLMQDYCAHDDVSLAEDVAPILADERYIRIDGRPLFLVYRPSLLPDPVATTARWRSVFRAMGVGEVLLACAQFDTDDPRPLGFDVAVEFPPHRIGWNLPTINDELPMINPRYDGRVHRYNDMVGAAKEVLHRPYPLFRTVCPSWDNEARRPGNGTTFHGAAPDVYEEWLRAAGTYARRHPVGGEHVVFVNAWNEWAEGAHLEPDRRYGHAFLEATHSALVELDGYFMVPSRLLMVVHDAYKHGAQLNALHMVKELTTRFHVAVDIVLLGRGELRSQFEQYGRVHDFATEIVRSEDQEALLKRLFAEGIDAAVCNTTVSGRLVRTLDGIGYRTITLVHELPGLISDHGLEGTAQEVARYSDVVVFPAEMVRQAFESAVGPVRSQSLVRPQGLYRLPDLPADLEDARRSLRRDLGVPDDAPVVLAAGWADLRKGFDLFVSAAQRTVSRRPDAVFVWLGCEDREMKSWYARDAEVLGFKESLRLLPRVDDVARYYSGADIFLLPSREDPFPSVALEALSYGLPVLAFEGATGVGKLLQRGCGLLVPPRDVDAMAAGLLELLEDTPRRLHMGAVGRAVIDEDFAWRDYIYFLLEQAGHKLHGVSVIVPNYNYALHLRQRLATVFGQTYPIREVIVLDDASTDGSVELLNALRVENGWDFDLRINDMNSGSVFQQWLRGVELARGDLIWIAEADDYADEHFLERLAPCFDDENVLLAYCQSRQVIVRGSDELVGDDYRAYVSDINDQRWSSSWVRSGRAELADVMSIKNTIPNVSGVLFRRDKLLWVLLSEIDFISSFRVAGDWAVYLHLLLGGGNIAFVAEALNFHRRHDQSVTKASFGAHIVAEIARMQQEVQGRVAVSDEAKTLAVQYLHRLCDQFNLPEATRRRLTRAADRPGTRTPSNARGRMAISDLRGNSC